MGCPLKIKPIDVDEYLKRKAFNNEMDSTLKVNDQTEEPVDAEDITEESRENHDNLDEESSVHLEYLPRKS